MRRGLTVLMCAGLVLTARSSPAIEQINRGDEWRRPKKIEHFGLRKDNENGLKYIADGKFEQAVKLYKKALDDFGRKRVQDPAFHAELLLNYSTALYEAGKDEYFKYKDEAYFQEALKALAECLALQPDNWRAMEVQGKIYVKMKRWEDAERTYAAAYSHLSEDDPEYKDAQARLEKELTRVEKFMKLKEAKEEKAEEYR